MPTVTESSNELRDALGLTPAQTKKIVNFLQLGGMVAKGPSTGGRISQIATPNCVKNMFLAALAATALTESAETARKYSELVLMREPVGDSLLLASQVGPQKTLGAFLLELIKCCHAPDTADAICHMVTDFTVWRSPKPMAAFTLRSGVFMFFAEPQRGLLEILQDGEDPDPMPKGMTVSAHVSSDIFKLLGRIAHHSSRNKELPLSQPGGGSTKGPDIGVSEPSDEGGQLGIRRPLEADTAAAKRSNHKRQPAISDSPMQEDRQTGKIGDLHRVTQAVNRKVPRHHGRPHQSSPGPG